MDGGDSYGVHIMKPLSVSHRRRGSQRDHDIDHVKVNPAPFESHNLVQPINGYTQLPSAYSMANGRHIGSTVL